MSLPRNLLRRVLARTIGGVGEAFVPLLERYVWFVPVSALLSLLASALEGFGIGLLIPLLTEALGADSAAGGSVPGIFASIPAMFPPDSRVMGVAACIFAAIFAKALLQTVHWAIVAWIDGNAGHEIRAALSQRLLSFGYTFFLTQNPARLVTIVSTDSWRASDAVRLVFSITSAGGAVLIFAVFLCVVSWKLAIFVAVGVVLIRLAQLAFARRLERLSDRLSSTNQVFASRMLTMLDSMRLIRVFSQEKREHARFKAASDEVRKALLEVEQNASMMSPAIEVLHTALFIGILLVALRMDLTLPATITFLALLYRMQPQLLALSGARLGLAALHGPVREVGWLLDGKDKPPAPGGDIPLSGIQAPIVFDRVSYTYPVREADSPALVDLSFTIHPGRALAVLGTSGSGKTTLVNLLCRLLEPAAGRICVDGRELRQIAPQAWLAHIALAGQDIDLVDGTITENIAYGRPDAAFELIAEAARLADAHVFIEALPDGYATTVGGRGLGLSGGQRQRIGIARALLRDPDLMILDEATNAVDGISEAAIMGMLKRREGRKTTVVISHRASTIAACQDGVVLDAGRLVEAGALRDLTFFARMAHLPP